MKTNFNSFLIRNSLKSSAWFSDCWINGNEFQFVWITEFRIKFKLN